MPRKLRFKLVIIADNIRMSCKMDCIGFTEHDSSVRANIAVTGDIMLIYFGRVIIAENASPLKSADLGIRKSRAALSSPYHD